MRARIALVAATVATTVGGGVLVSSAVAKAPEQEPAAYPEWQPPPPLADPSPRTDRLSPPSPAEVGPALYLDLRAEVSVAVDGFLTWAALDRRSGETAGFGQEASTAESMINPWIVADYLRTLDENGQRPSDEEVADARAAIRDSDDRATQRLYTAGGRDDVVERIIDRCGLTDTEVHPSWWSRTEVTARDAVRLGECLVSGTAAGPGWTGWVLNEMRQVRGAATEPDRQPEQDQEGGRWGLVDGLPPPQRAEVSIKNGWTRIGETGSWHLNCLALTPEWVLAVLMRYPAGYRLEYGAERCASVSAQLSRPHFINGRVSGDGHA